MSGDGVNTITNGLRVCIYTTRAGFAGFVEETRRGGHLLGFVSGPDRLTCSLRAARLVASSSSGAPA